MLYLLDLFIRLAFMIAMAVFTLERLRTWWLLSPRGCMSQQCQSGEELLKDSWGSTDHSPCGNAKESGSQCWWRGQEWWHQGKGTWQVWKQSSKSSSLSSELLISEPPLEGQHTFKDGTPTSVNIVKKITHRCAQRLTYKILQCF